MTSREALLRILRASREDLIQKSTDIALIAGDTPIPRAELEQMLRACVAVIEEGLAGESTDIRSMFLAAMPDVARTTTWELTIKAGLPCWGVILGQLAAATSTEHRDEAIVWLSKFMGEWWSDVSSVMLPVFDEKKV